MTNDPINVPLAKAVEPFFREIACGEVDIYNEFSLQHELDISLRNRFTDSKVRFERNVASLFAPNVVFTKREIDICIVDRTDHRLQYAIELKFPRNGQHPEQMFSFCKDIAFAEELKRAGFTRSGLVIFADDPLFWRGPAEGIYGYFRGGRCLTGSIQKPTGNRDWTVNILGSYYVEWSSVTEAIKAAVIEIC
jgi:hypothetical protein